jgi:hypothetical protein
LFIHEVYVTVEIEDAADNLRVKAIVDIIMANFLLKINLLTDFSGTNTRLLKFLFEIYFLAAL